MSPKKKNISIIDYTNQVIARLVATYGPETVTAVFDKGPVALDPDTNEIIFDGEFGTANWNQLFSLIYDSQGSGWLVSLEKFVNELVSDKRIPLPDVYQSLIFQAEKKTDALSEAALNLLETKEDHEVELRKVADQLIRCPITSLYNESFFESYLTNEMKEYPDNWCLGLVAPDNISQVLFEQGEKTLREILVASAYLLNDKIKPEKQLFRLDGNLFAFYIRSINREEALEAAEKLRVAFERSDLFYKPITVTMGIVTSSDIGTANRANQDLKFNVTTIARYRLKLASESGGNTVCHESAVDNINFQHGKILIADTDSTNQKLLERYFTNSGLEIITCDDGLDALELIQSGQPDLVISELSLPRMDVFRLRQKMLESSDLKKIPFIILSHQKSEADIQRAYRLEISHYLQKPCSLAEISGIVDNLL